MTQYRVIDSREYLTPEQLTEWLNTQAALGWELVSVVHLSDYNLRYIFRRLGALPKEEEAK